MFLIIFKPLLTHSVAPDFTSDSKVAPQLEKPKNKSPKKSKGSSKSSKGTSLGTKRWPGVTHSRRAGNAPSVDWGSQNHKMPAAAASSRSSRKLRSHNSLLRVTRPAFARAKRQWATTLAIAVHSFKMFQTLQTKYFKYACARSLALSHCVPLCKDRVLLCELCVEVLAHARKVLKEANARLAAGEAFVLHAICLRASFAMHYICVRFQPGCRRN